MPENLPTPVTEEEKFMAKAAGMDVATPTPVTRTEKYLNAIAEGGGGGGFTPTQSQLDAMNSGITEQKVNGIDHLVFSANSKTYYLQPEQPQNPQDGDIWIG